MGNTNKHVKESTFKGHHPQLTKAKLIEDKNRSYIEATFKAQAKEYEEWEQKLKAGNCRPDFLFLPEQHKFKNDTGLCGNTGSLTNEYPFYTHVLSDLIRQRQIEKNFFKESQLWYELFALTAALQEIKRRTIKLGDIKPQNIFVNDQGQIKVANVYSWPNERASYARVLEFDRNDSDSLLAPEDMALLQTNHLDNDGNEESEVFAIGATVLCTAILENFRTVYNFKEKSIDLVALRQRKAKFGEQERYSTIFKAIVLCLLGVSPSDRLTADELWEFIRPFEQSILRKEQFVIPQAPQKVEMTLAAFKNRIY